MEQKIAFDLALGLTAADLAAAWNTNPTTAAHGPARTEAAPPGQFMDFAEMGFMVVSSIAVNLLSSYLYDLIKDSFADRPAPTIAVHQIDQPDGAKLMVTDFTAMDANPPAALRTENASTSIPLTIKKDS